MNFLEKYRRIMVYMYHWVVEGLINFLKNPKPLLFYNRLDINSMIDGIHLVRHAGGEIDENVYTNSKEAIELSVNRGCHIVELDFLKLDDNYICFHDVDSMGFNKPESLVSFHDHKIKSKYTPLTLDDILKLMEQFPKLIVITDCKDRNVMDLVEAISIKLRDTNKCDWCERFIVQVYSISQAKELDRDYPSFIKGLTLYASSYYVWDFPWLTKMCIIYHIPILIMPYNYVINKYVIKCLKRKNIKVWVHTVNDKLIAEMLKGKGVDGIYSDILHKW